MNVLIVEDEPPVARELKRQMKNLLGAEANVLRIEPAIEGARCYFLEKPVDLLVLDLDLDGDDGFKILDEVKDHNFHTIVVSARSERAIEAFERGVVDFLPKPATEERLRVALDRLIERQRRKPLFRKLAIQAEKGLELIDPDKILYLLAEGKGTFAKLRTGEILALRKNIGSIGKSLPDTFLRVHKSHIVNTHHICKLEQVSERKYFLVMEDSAEIFVSRSLIPRVKEILLHTK